MTSDSAGGKSATRPTAEEVWRRLIEDRPTIFFGVPTLYASMLADPDALAARRA